MAAATLDVSIALMREQLARDLAQVPGLTKKMEREVTREAVRAEVERQRASQTASKAATAYAIEQAKLRAREEDKAATDAQKAWDRYLASLEGGANDAGGALGRVGKEADKLSRVGSLVGGRFGGAIQLVADASESWADGLSEVTKRALVLGAAFGGIVAAGAGVVHVIRQAAEGVREWDKLRETVGYTSAEFVVYADEVRAARTAQEGAERSAARLQARMAGELAPAIEDATLLWSKFTRELGTGAAYAIGRVASLMAMIPGMAGTIARERERVEAEAFHAGVEADKARAKEMLELVKERAEKEAEEVQRAAEKAQADRERAADKARREAEAARKADERARQEAVEQERRLDAEGARWLADYKIEQQRRVEAEVQRSARSNQEREREQLQQRADAHRSAMERIVQQEQLRAQAATDVSNRALAGAQSLASNVMALADLVTQNEIDSYAEGSKAQREAMMKQFKAKKAAAIATAAINTALSVTETLASTPYPANIVLAALTAAAGGVQIGLIAAQKPVLHTGGMIEAESGPRPAPDERDIRAQVGEGVLSRQGMAALAALNRGMAPAGMGGGGTTILALDGRVLDVLASGQGMTGRGGLVRRFAGRLPGRIPGRRGR